MADESADANSGSGLDWGSLLGAGLSSAASIYNTYQQRKINKEQLRFAKFNLDTQVNLANTAHQREVRDLRAAGLNPILSAQGSDGAGNVSPTSYNPEAPSIDGVARAAQLFFSAKNAETARIAADTQAWNIVDAKDFGRASFDVLGFGTGGKLETVKTLRINKVTGECFTLDGRRVKVKDIPEGEVTVGPIEDVPPHSGKSVWHKANEGYKNKVERMKRTSIFVP